GGFTAADFDRIPLTQQVRLIQQAHAIVAVHGSALGHLLHAPQAGRSSRSPAPATSRPTPWAWQRWPDGPPTSPRQPPPVTSPTTSTRTSSPTLTPCCASQPPAWNETPTA